MLLLVVCLRRPATRSAGYAAADWVRIAALTVTGQLLGHSLMNLVLRSISPTIVCLATLFTVPGAALIAAVDARRDAAGGDGPGGRIAARRDRARDQRA